MTDTFNTEVEKMVAQMAEKEASAKRQKEVEEEAKYRFALSKVPETERQQWDALLVDKEKACQQLSILVKPCEFHGYPQRNCAKCQYTDIQFQYMRRSLKDFIAQREQDERNEWQRKKEEAAAAAKAEEERKVEVARKEAAEKAEAERKRLEAYAKEKEEYFQKWIRDGADYSTHALIYARQCNNKFYIYWGNKDELASAFWKYIEQAGGFSKCPSCGQVPHINRTTSQYCYGMPNNYATGFTEGLFHKLTWDQSQASIQTKIQTISHCDHLFDYEQTRRYIKVSALKYFDTPKVKYQVCCKIGRSAHGHDEMGYTDKTYINPDCIPEYTLYNVDDPDGSAALTTHQQKVKIARIEELQMLIAAMQKELCVLTDQSPA
jgi:hypothetical protein